MEEEYEKNDKVAKELRVKANELYQKSQFYDALVKYNESLCYSTVGSEDMAFAYANRSAVYFELKYYDKVITNIQKALENNYPEEKKKTLLDRKEKAEKLIGTMPQEEEKQSAEDYFKLTYDPNPKYPSFADCIELRKNKYFGRYLVTSRDLKIGDIIAVEEFLYYTIIKGNNCDDRIKSSEPMNYQLCAFCHKSNLLDLQPCKQCTTTMYCNEKCSEDNINRGHFYECLTTSTPSVNDLHPVISAFFYALSICNGSIDEFEELIDEIESYKKLVTIFDFDFSKMTEIEKKKKLIQIIYCGHPRKFTIETYKSAGKLIQSIFMQHDITAIMFKANAKFIVKFIIHMMEVEAKNAFALHKEIPKIKAITVCAGNGLCPGLSLLNHSCVPNVMRVHVGNKFALVVIRKVKKGQQLFDGYTKSYMATPKNERMEELKKYGFVCKCIACTKNFPTFEDYPEEGSMIERSKRMHDFLEHLERYEQCTSISARECLEEYLPLLNEKFNSDSYAIDYDLAIENLITCYIHIIMGDKDRIP